MWRLLTPWPEPVLRQRLRELADKPVNFDAAWDEMIPENGWTVDGGKYLLGAEPPGAPREDSLFERARKEIIAYRFSDPAILQGYFDPAAELLGRNMLLEMRVWGLRYLVGVRVQSVLALQEADQTCFGYRYDTLEGHIERGSEWFLLTKDHGTGQVRFEIEAHWQVAGFPNWWSKVGFHLVGEQYRREWRNTAPRRLARLVNSSSGTETPARAAFAVSAPVKTGRAE